MKKRIIQFHVYKSETHYVAQAVDLPIVTQGKTLDEVVKNIKEAVELHLDGENLAEFDLAPNPQVLVNFEVAPEMAHA